MSVQPTVSAHHLHDELLIARLAGDDVTPTERAAAVGLVETCAECAALAADLRAIISDMATLPAPPRPRDFRLTPADAARLQPRDVLARIPLLRSLGTAPKHGFAGALGAAMATLGLAGILVSGASTLLPQAESTALFAAGGGGGAAPQSQAGAPSYAAPAPSLGVELTTPPRVATGPASSPASGAGASTPASPSASALGQQPSPAATAAAAASASAAAGGTPTRDTVANASPGALATANNAGEARAGPAAEPSPQPPSQPIPIVPIASLGLVVVGLGLLLYARLAGGRPPV